MQTAFERLKQKSIQQSIQPDPTQSGSSVFETLKKKSLSVEPVEPTPQMEQKGIGGAITGFGKGFFKGAGSTLFGLGTLAEKGISAISGIKRENIGIVGEEKPEYLIPQTTAEKIGYGAESIAEFLIPSTAILKATKGLGLIGRMGVEAGLSAGQTAIKEGGITDDVKTSAIIGAAFPLLGAGFKVIKSGLSRGLVASGEKIQFTKLRPNASDIEDGFKIGTLRKYDLGGSLEQTFLKTETKLKSLSAQLKSELSKAQKYWAPQDRVPVNLNKVYQRTAEKLGITKARQFGDIGAIENKGLSHLKNEIDLATNGTGNVDIFTGQFIKQGAGRKGAWQYGMADENSKAIEKTYTAFYRELKTELEKLGTPKIRAINKQISELIPISNAIIRRMPIDARNNAISLTDSIGLYGAMFNPKALVLLGASKLSKSGRFANVLIKAGESLKKQPTSVIGQRFMGITKPTK